MSPLSQLTATEAARRIAAGELRASEYAAALIETVAAREPEVQAWAHFDADYVLAEAKKADLARETGQPCGPLHGVPFAVKDIFDTADMPTEYGTPLCAGRRTMADASAVRQLREAGGIVMGKSVTAELAVLHPGKTRNPHDPSRTPGGSSSGSAAAVAAGMAPLALGTQTNGSVIRPASFCGVYGYKPSFGLISRTGVLEESSPLDTVGVFARCVEDVALAADAMSAHDPLDAGSWPRSRAAMLPVVLSEPPLAPNFALVKTPFFDRADPVTQEAFAELADTLGERCVEIALPDVFVRVERWQRAVMFADIARNYAPLYERGASQMSATLRAIVEEGRGVLALDYNEARVHQSALHAVMDDIFDRFDAILTPAARGPAPLGLGATGDPIFCTIWTFLGSPALSMPLLEADGMPLGVQLVGPRRDDARLLRSARWLAKTLESAS